eukprot:TRINITY_DN46084_c0_g1_i1.p1 TRINITY_DN46084_c0_g1~~TRINITY_DN46084_c0_g1_i1.p1  ORF type:complete len:449 (-),score=79.94 TRINITY_DN46084_c0_g1_i1:102-1448(-)
MGSAVSCSEPGGCEASGCDASITIPSDSPLAASLAGKKPNITIYSTDKSTDGAEDEVAETARSNSRPGSPTDELSPVSSEKHAMLVKRRRHSGFLGGNVKDFLEGQPLSRKLTMDSRRRAGSGLSLDAVVAPSFQRTISSGDTDGSESSPGSPNYKKATLGSAEEDLLCAARGGKLAAVERALSLGVDVNCTDNSGRTPLFLVAGSFGKGSLDVMERLLKADADIEATDGRKWTPLHYACCNSRDDTTLALVSKSASVNALTADGRTPIILAIQSGSHSSGHIRVLIDHKADLAIKDENGSSVLWFACHAGYRSAMKIFLKQKADPNDDSDDGVTPLMLAARKGDLEIGKLLYQYNCDFKAQGQGGSNALMEAIRYDMLDFASWLVEIGTSTLPKDNRGQTAADIAEDRGHLQWKAKLDQKRRMELGEVEIGEPDTKPSHQGTSHDTA